MTEPARIEPIPPAPGDLDYATAWAEFELWFRRHTQRCLWCWSDVPPGEEWGRGHTWLTGSWVVCDCCGACGRGGFRNG